MTLPPPFNKYRPSRLLRAVFDEFGAEITTVLVLGWPTAITHAKRGLAPIEVYLIALRLQLGDMDCRRHDVHKLLGSMVAFLLRQSKYYKAGRVTLGENPCDVRKATVFVYDPDRPQEVSDADEDDIDDDEG